MYICVDPLDPDSRLPGSASEGCLILIFSRLLHSFHSLIFSVYYQRVLEAAIAVVPTAICGAIPRVLVLLKLFPVRS